MRNSVSTFSKGDEATGPSIHASTSLNDSLSYDMLPSVFDGPDTSAKPHVSNLAARTAKSLCDWREILTESTETCVRFSVNVSRHGELLALEKVRRRAGKVGDVKMLCSLKFLDQ